MGRKFAWGRGFLPGGAMLLLAATPAPHPAPNALDALQPGMWEIRMLGPGAATRRRLCLADPAALVQLRHGAASCTRLVISNSARNITVHYSCSGGGWGRTSLYVESPDQVSIDSQGIAGNAPFSFKADAKRAGGCAPLRSSSR